MKQHLCFVTLFFLLFSFFSFSQIGIRTNSPTNTLDVNGSSRIRTLNSGLIYTSNTGVLNSDSSSLISFVEGQSLWGSLKVGSKSTILIFNGIITSTNVSVSFVVHYDVGDALFKNLLVSNCSVIDLGASPGNNGRLRVVISGVNYDLIFVNTDDYAIVTSSVGSIEGSFMSIVDNTI